MHFAGQPHPPRPPALPNCVSSVSLFSPPPFMGAEINPATNKTYCEALTTSGATPNTLYSTNPAGW